MDCPFCDSKNIDEKLHDCRCRKCKTGIHRFNKYCGAYVCDICEDHKGMAQCFCGWKEGGGVTKDEDFDDAPIDDLP